MEYVIFIGCILALVIIAKVLSWPFKIVLKLILNCIISLIIVTVINAFFPAIHIPLNYVTASILGIFGIPGILILLLLQFII